MNSAECRMRDAECGVPSAERNARVPGGFALSVLLAIVVLTGCAEKGPILLTIGYQAPAEKTLAASTIVVGVSPFRDAREAQPTVLGRRTIPNGMQSELVVRGTVAEVATISLKEALTRRGIAVKDVAEWDLTAAGMPAVDAALVLGGEVKVFWLESSATALHTQLKATVQLKVAAGDTGAMTVIRTIEVNSKLDQEVLYSRERLENILSEALSSSIDQILRDEVLKRRL